MTPEDRALEVLEAVAREIASFYRALPETPVGPVIPRRELERQLTRYRRFPGPVPLARLVEDVWPLLRDGLVHVTHPRYFGFFNPSVSPAAIVGELLAAALNPQLAVAAHAPVAVALERLVLDHVLEVFGMAPDTCAAQFTGGGSEANLHGVLSALVRAFPTWPQEGARAAVKRPTVWVGPAAHESIAKLAVTTGLGRASVRVAPSRDGRRIDPVALAEALAQARRGDEHPFLLVATAGATTDGAIDPLRELADLAAQESLWLHVDAAWAGAVRFSPRLRSLLAGIERADSVTCDAHKWLGVPLVAGMFLTRDPAGLQRLFDVGATRYMPGSPTSAAADPYRRSLAWSRRFVGLKVFLTLAELGREGLAARIDHMADMGSLIRRRLADAGWTVVSDTPLPVACFTRTELADEPERLKRGVRSIWKAGRVWISDVELLGRSVLRCSVCSFRTGPPDVDILIGELRRVFGP